MKSSHQSALDSLRAENARLEAESKQLLDKLRRLGANPAAPTTQERMCISCGRWLPDGPLYFPGYRERASADRETELRRHHCVYCRQESDSSEVSWR
jgi:hypothetical protein